MATTKKTETKTVAIKEEVKNPAPTAEMKVKTAVKEEAVKKVEEPKKETAPKKEIASKKESTPKKEIAPKKEAAPKKAESVKKEAVKKETAPKKAPEKKEIKSSVYVQYMDREIPTDTLVAAAKKSYVAAGNKATDIKTIDIYVKPEENAAYYVINGIGSEDYKIIL